MFQRIPPATRALLIANAVVFLLQWATRDAYSAPFALWPVGGDGYGSITLPHMRDMTILGPSNVTGVSETASRRRVFTCRPASAGEEETCAAQIVRGLVTQAYRGKGTAQGKMDALRAAGVKVGLNPTEAGDLMAEIVAAL